MSEARSWNRYACAREAFEADPSLINEGIAVAAYAEFVRAFCPDHADTLITLCCRYLSDVGSRKAA